MILLVQIVSFAHAELPWACPEIAEPADALVLMTDAGLEDVVDALEVEVWAYEGGCTWTMGEPYGEETCTTAAGATYTYSWLAWEDETTDEEAWSVEVVLPEGAADWTWMTFTYARSSSSGSSTGGSETRRTASWLGQPLGLPADTDVAYERGGSNGFSSDGFWLGGEAGDCAWSWDDWDDHATEIHQVTARTPDHVVTVRSDQAACARQGHVYAELDGVLWGSVDWNTWALAEVDRDGWSSAEGDCDDLDPLRYPCAAEIAGDGLDSDCDGADELDIDGDGHDDAALGGDDCDDAEPYVHPGANDTPGDGRDVDCDGHDDVDADGDGYTADGDDQPVDCDDDDPASNPGAAEAACDGVDQDCDGADLCDADTGGDTGDTGGETDGADTADTDEAPEESGGGCGSGSASLLFVPFMAPRRRWRRR